MGAPLAAAILAAEACAWFLWRRRHRRRERTVGSHQRRNSAHACDAALVAGLPSREVAEGCWFTELGDGWPGQGLSIRVDQVLYTGRSEYQDLAVFRSEAFGTVLTLDGVVQLTTSDEFSYQEMIAHLPLCGIKEAAKRVLVVGGGDGGVLREVTRYASIEHIDMAEIDDLVVQVSKEWFPDVAIGFSDPRVNLVICDGIEFLRKAEEGTYDAIIVDSSDPIGPAEAIFQRPFIECLHKALRPGGVVCAQGQSIWLELPIIKELTDIYKSVFGDGLVNYAQVSVPTYTSGQIGFVICTKGGTADGLHDVKIPKREPPGQGPLMVQQLKYYNHEMHRAAFALPQYAAKVLDGSSKHKGLQMECIKDGPTEHDQEAPRM